MNVKAHSPKLTIKAVALPMASVQKPVRGRCFHLGKRTEFRAGCSSGSNCKHECKAGMPFAIPAGKEKKPGHCQECGLWERE